MFAAEMAKLEECVEVHGRLSVDSICHHATNIRLVEVDVDSLRHLTVSGPGCVEGRHYFCLHWTRSVYDLLRH